jgi:hypothetical protein
MLSSMFRNNWIRVPFIAALAWIGAQLLFNIISPLPLHLWRLIFIGLLFGFSLQTLNWLRARKKFGKVGQEVTETRHKRNFMLMQDRSSAIETCRRAIQSLPDLKLRSVDAGSGIINVRSKIKRVGWGGFTWGNLISIKLVEVGEQLTEINMESKPFMPTVLIDSGEAWATIERLVAAIKDLDSQPPAAALNDGAEMIHELTNRPINFSR